ncbi:MAG: helix-turn-helix domain-containing protein [Oscillospiraceae bacterium]|jgi:transcriptional regulator with XRE-family HTH domain|nr:helix-turn-helix domain-containing protein [Oscillospiraceae bacterium]
MKFNEILTELRENKFLSKTELAKAINTTRQQITAYENGNTTPNIVTFLALADYFDVSADYFLGRKEYVTVQRDKNKRYVFLPDELTAEDYEVIKDLVSTLYRRRAKKD